MKKFLHNCLLWLSFLFVISCQKNEETPTATMTFLINDQSSYPNPPSKYWALISDQTGKVLSWQSLSTNALTSLTYAAKDSVNLTIIASYTGGYYDLRTHANAAPGSYSTTLPFQSPSILGTYKVQIPSPTDYQLVEASSECGATSKTDGSEWQINVCANSSLYVMAQKTNAVPRYLYSPQISTNGSVVIDATTYNSLPEMKTRNVLISGSYDFGFLFLNVIKDSNPNWFYLSSSYSSSNAVVQPLYYPDQIGSAFDEYNIAISLFKPNMDVTFVSTVKDLSNYTIPSFTPTLDVVTSATTSNLNFDLSGSADYVETIFSSSHNPWTIYTPFSKKVTTVLPIFPDDLKKEIDFSFLSTMKLQSIAIGDTDLGGYRSFYANDILGQKKSAKNSKYKKYTPKTDGSIGGD